MRPTRIIVHCTATKNGGEYTVDQLEKDHLARGFDGIGYHIYIDSYANAHNTRSLNKVGAHCKGENHDSIGIAMAGTDKFSQQQFNVLRSKIDAVMQLYSIPAHNLFCHYQFPSAVVQGKTCPNIPINNLLYWYNTQDEKAISDWILPKN
jgi:hypothetical protein